MTYKLTIHESIKHFFAFCENYSNREDMLENIHLGNIDEDHYYFRDIEAFKNIREFIENVMNKNSITLTVEQAEEVMEALKWSIDEYEKQDDIDKEIYKTYRSTYYSIKKQIEVLKNG